MGDDTVAVDHGAEIAQLKEAVEKLQAKNKELLEEKKATKSGAELKLAEAQEKIEELTGQIEATKRDYDKATKALAKERDEAVKAAQSETAANQRLLIDNGLTDALTKAGVRKELLPAARALLKEQGIITIESEGDIRRAVARLAIDGKESSLGLEDYVVKHFATTEAGKAFIPASMDSGSGASGSSTIPATGRTLLRQQYDKALADGNADAALALKAKLSGT